jgi:gliding motility-associated-like protein
VDDVTGPVVQHEAFNDIILLGIPVGIEAAISDDSEVAGSTLYFRLEGEIPFRPAPTTLTPPGSGNTAYKAVGVLEPGDLPAGEVLEYYFTAVDQYGNSGISVGGSTNPFRANLVPATQVVTSTLPVNGGVVKFPVGDPRLPWLEVSFPAGSLSSGGTMTTSLEPSDTVAPHKGRAPARAYEFLPDGLRFLRPVTMELPYSDIDPSDGTVDGTDINELDLRVFWWDGFAWRYVGGQVDPAANRVRVNVTHFSLYGLFPMGTLTADTVRPKEKIITPNGDGKNDVVTFEIDPLDGGFEIEVFDIRGAVVRRLDSVREWDGRNDDGEVVESGTYVYRLEGQGMTVTGMIAVAR